MSRRPLHLFLTLLAGAIALGLAACQNQPAQPTADAAKPDAASADQFVADINAKLKKDYPEMTAAQWLSVTYINGDTQLLAAKSNEKFLGELKANVDKSTMAARIKHVMQATFNGRRIVVFSGGEAKDLEGLFTEIRGLRDGGANGSIIGRNTFQRPRDQALDMLDKIIGIYQGKM